MALEPEPTAASNRQGRMQPLSADRSGAPNSNNEYVISGPVRSSHYNKTEKFFEGGTRSAQKRVG